jgi:hypothetical protein
MDKEDYTHWFWNSALVDWFAQILVSLDSWIYDKQYGER